jgi:hypothetical protein
MKYQMAFLFLCAISIPAIIPGTALIAENDKVIQVRITGFRSGNTLELTRETKVLFSPSIPKDNICINDSPSSIVDNTATNFQLI